MGETNLTTTKSFLNNNNEQMPKQLWLNSSSVINKDFFHNKGMCIKKTNKIKPAGCHLASRSSCINSIKICPYACDLFERWFVFKYSLRMLSEWGSRMLKINYNQESKRQQRSLKKAWTDLSLWLTVSAEMRSAEHRGRVRMTWVCNSSPLLCPEERASPHPDWTRAECTRCCQLLIMRRSLHPCVTGERPSNLLWGNLVVC